MNKKESAFTLVELAIVITIIGLLVVGVLQGSELIKKARLRSILSDFESYKSATYSFKGVYNGLPGDLVDAYDYFSNEAGCANSINLIDDQTGCNGNGDGNITDYFNGSMNPPGSVFESLRAWQHLSLAKLIKGSYPGVTSGIAHYGTPGVDIPSTSLNRVGMAFLRSFSQGDDGWFFSGKYPISLLIGSPPSIVNGPAFSAKDAYSIDIKIDDGKPGLGNVRTRALKANPECTTSSTGAVSDYKIDDSISCTLIMFLL